MKNYLRPLLGVQLLVLCSLGLTAQLAAADDAKDLATVYARLTNLQLKPDSKSNFVLKERTIYQKNKRAYCFDSLTELNKDLDVIYGLQYSSEKLQEREDLKPLMSFIEHRAPILRNYCLSKWDPKLRRIPTLRDLTKFLDQLDENAIKALAALEPLVLENEKLLSEAQKCAITDVVQSLPIEVPAEELSTEERIVPEANVTIESIKKVDVDQNGAYGAVPHYSPLPQKHEAARGRVAF